MAVTIPGWTITNDNAAKIQSAMAGAIGKDAADDTAADVQNYLANIIRELVDRDLRKQRDTDNPINTSDVLT